MTQSTGNSGRSLTSGCYHLRCNDPAGFLLGQHDGLVEPRDGDGGGRQAARLSVHLHRDHFRGDDLGGLALGDAGPVAARLE